MDLRESFASVGGDYDEVLARLANDTLVKKFLTRFLDDQTHASLVEFLDQKNYAEAFRMAHTLKGVCANLGLGNLQKSSSELTEALRGGEPTVDISGMVAQVAADYDQAIAMIQGIQ